MLQGAESAGWPEEPALDQKRRPFWRTPFSAIRRAFSRRPDNGPVTCAGGKTQRSAARTPSPPLPPPLSPAPALYLAAPPPPPTAGTPLLDTRLAREVRRLLGTLGATRGSVAAALEVAGVRAMPHDPVRSPIGLFLGAVIGADPNVKCVRVDPDAVIVDVRAWWRPTVTVPLPPVVHDFRMAFDAGCYPALLRDEFRPDGIDHPHGPDAEHAD